MKAYLEYTAEQNGTKLLQVESNIFQIIFSGVLNVQQKDKEKFKVKISNDLGLLEAAYQSVVEQKKNFVKFVQQYKQQDQNGNMYLNFNAKWDQICYDYNAYYQQIEYDISNYTAQNEQLKTQLASLKEVQDPEKYQVKQKTLKAQIKKEQDDLFKLSMVYDVAVREAGWKQKQFGK